MYNYYSRSKREISVNEGMGSTGANQAFIIDTYGIAP